MPDMLLCCVWLYVGYKSCSRGSIWQVWIYNPYGFWGAAYWGGLIACSDSLHAHHEARDWNFIYKLNRIESWETNYLSAWRHAAKLGLQVPWLWLSTQHFNMYGIPWTHPVSELLFEFKTSPLLFIWDFQSAQMKTGEEEWRKNNKWEQARRREIKTEAPRDDKHAECLCGACEMTVGMAAVAAE